MPRGYWSCRVLGFTIRVDRSWLFIAALVTWTLSRHYFPSVIADVPTWVYWSMGASAAVLLFTCVLLHELGHALVARAYGIPVAGITLFIFGGVAQIAGQPKRPAVEFLMALAGPLVSAVIAGSCALAVRAIPLVSPGNLVVAAIVHYLAMVNMALILFNLLPGFPLDGGRLLRAALWAGLGNFHRATRIASRVGIWLGIALIGFGVWGMIRGSIVGGVWYVFLGLFLRDAALATYRTSDG